MTDALIMWTVYDSPADRPGKFVVRKFEVGMGGVTKPTGEAYEADTIEPIRDYMLRLGLGKLERFPNDEPHIVEVWL